MGVTGGPSAPIRVAWLHPFFPHDDTHPMSEGEEARWNAATVGVGAEAVPILRCDEIVSFKSGWSRVDE
ncbi:hypothetical protein Y032_0207g2043 [Ancylostoma ceylanicum]|uniref:Uncharacterized protein n=1 Tax=Ancylostoma ceylanicum TaxID=53326 RepID=A0A016SLV2_9BILA|nr:hypothetical protein Y032_0207g2043 [Ancylostoma ceylanicum]